MTKQQEVTITILTNALADWLAGRIDNRMFRFRCSEVATMAEINAVEKIPAMGQTPEKMREQVAKAYFAA